MSDISESYYYSCHGSLVCVRADEYSYFVDSMIGNPDQYKDAVFHFSKITGNIPEFPYELDKEIFLLNDDVYLLLKVKSFSFESNSLILFKGIDFRKDIMVDNKLGPYKVVDMATRRRVISILYHF